MSNTQTLSPIQAKIRETIFSTFQHEVIKVPLAGPDNQRSPHYGLCFDSLDAPKPLWMQPTVKKHYVPHTREDVAVLCETIALGLDLPLDQITIDCFFKPAKGQRVAVQPTTKYRKSVCSKNGADTLWPKFILNANYGGSFQAYLGMHRDVCSNMQMMRRVEGTTVNLRHHGNFRDHFDETVKQWKTLAAKFDNIVEAANHLKETRFNTADFYQHLYPEPSAAESKTKHRNRDRKLQKMMNRLIDERMKLGEGNVTKVADLQTANLWELVNSVTGFVQHEKRQTQNGLQLSKSAKGFLAVDDPECNHAWDFALSNAG